MLTEIRETLQSHVAEIRPRFEGSNINTWIGFKHVMYMVEEAVLDTLRANGLLPGDLFERHGVCFEIVDSDVRILTAFHMDDVARFEVQPGAAPDGELVFRVTGNVRRSGAEVKAVGGTVRAVLRLDRSVASAPPLPAQLAGAIRREIRRDGAAGPARVVPGGGARATPLATERGGTGLDGAIRAVVPPGANAFVWKWHVPYFYCHFNDRMQHSGYVRLVEEVVDLFLADRGISIRTMMDARRWIPVVPQARMTLLGEALMEETIYTVFTVRDIFKARTYAASVDVYALRDGALVQTATGGITHGYAHMVDRREWTLAELDPPTLAALAAPGAGTKRAAL
jgi:acyl-CoA thioesterase FadM